jgi:hypothetical protein
MAWDLRSRKEVSLKGELKDLRWATYAFAGPDRLVVSRDRQGLVYNAWVSAIVDLPSAHRISKLNLPPVSLSRTAGPGFIIVQAKFWRHSGDFPFRAIEYRTGRTIGNETAAMDVFRDRYIVQRPGKAWSCMSMANPSCDWDNGTHRSENLPELTPTRGRGTAWHRAPGDDRHVWPACRKRRSRN